MSRDEYERDILRNVEEHGWFCTSVFDPEGNAPTFAYSVGFTETLRAPEFIVFGLPTKLMHSVLWSVFNGIKGGRRPEDMQRWSGLLEGHDCVIRAVHSTNIVPEYLNSAMWFRHRQTTEGQLQAFQVVWPGVNSGLFPWDDECPQIVRDSQLPLYLPNPAYH